MEPDKDIPRSLLFPKIELDMRQRSNSDSRVVRRPSKKSKLALPEIHIIGEDSSSRANLVSRVYNYTEDESEIDDFFSRSNIGRPRSSTCPDDLFRQKIVRPPTPPPSDEPGPNKFIYKKRKTPRDKVAFQRHALGKVSEDSPDSTGDNNISSKQGSNGLRRLDAIDSTLVSESPKTNRKLKNNVLGHISVNSIDKQDSDSDRSGQVYSQKETIPQDSSDNINGINGLNSLENVDLAQELSRLGLKNGKSIYQT